MGLTVASDSGVYRCKMRWMSERVACDQFASPGCCSHRLLQDAMAEYLKERNIGDDMAAFICMYADYKEQTEYLNWLQEVESFIK